MNIAIGSDMKTNLTDMVIAELEERGHTVEQYGALVKEVAPWPEVGVEVAREVASGKSQQGILFCWTGTGITIAANKVRGVRAALCSDAGTARGARKWNDANVLAMSIRTVTEAIAREILDAWFETKPSEEREDTACLDFLERYELEHLPEEPQHSAEEESLPQGRIE